MVAALGYDAGKIRVPLHQFVTISEGGQTKRMSTRKGEFVTLDELVDDVGPDAVRYFMLARAAESHMDFDLELARKHSNENPVYYVQYAHARIAGILRNVSDQQLVAQSHELEAEDALSVEERELVKRLLEFPQVAREAAERRAPHAIPNYAIRVADDFHRFYHHHRVLGSESEGFRLALCAGTQQIVAHCLDLVGVEAPERM